MKNNKKLTIAFALAFATLSAQAQGGRMDIQLAAPSAGAVEKGAAPASVVAASASAHSNKMESASQERKTETPASTKTPVPTTMRGRTHARRPEAPVVEKIPAPPTAPTAPTAAPVPAQVSAPSTEANPFTGKPLNAEQRQRELENAKMDTDIIQEKLKQASLLADLTYLPLKKKSEIAALPGMKETMSAVTAKSPAAAEPKKPARSKTKANKSLRKAEQAAPTAPAPAPPVITLTGVSINGAQASAILETSSGAMSAKNGEITPFGQLRVLNSHTVNLGGRVLTVRDSVIARMAVSDAVVADPTKQAPSTPASAPVSAAPSFNGANGHLTLPPLPPLPAPPKGMLSMAPTPAK